MRHPIRLATCTYQEFAPTMGTPVRTTAGHPRFTLTYRLAGKAPLITPPWALVKAGLPADAYEFRYRRMLSDHGIDAIREELTAIAGAWDLETPLVLLCFDRLDKADGWCHRTMFATWWTEQTGEDVPELGAVRAAAPKPPAALFDLGDQ